MSSESASSKTWTFGPADGDLTLHTGVTGRASKMGHRLTLGMTEWQLAVDWSDDVPTGVTLSTELASLQVRKGEGGLTPLSGPEKAVVKSNALKVFDAKKFPRAEFRSTDVTVTDDGFRLAGTLSLHGTEHPVTVEVATDGEAGAQRLTGRAEVRHSDFGLKPFSMAMGSLKVADPVAVECTVTRGRND
ncbi:MAG TPA: YceI family protein [Mycobacterium sp.]|nr:YceI family protein [Mycobacterium sp.]